MLKRIIQGAAALSKAAVKGAIAGSGTAALYLCTSTLLAAVLLAAYLTYAWDIDRDQWYRALAVLQGIELAEQQQAAREAAAEIHRGEVLEARARRNREDEFLREIRAEVFALPPRPEIPVPEPPAGPSEEELIARQVEAARALASAAGLAQLVEDISKMVPDMGKEVIRRIFRENPDRVMLILNEMEERPRDRILQSFVETNADEMRDLVEILNRIGDGEPMISTGNNPQG